MPRAEASMTLVKIQAGRRRKSDEFGWLFDPVESTILDLFAIPAFSASESYYVRLQCKFRSRCQSENAENRHTHHARAPLGITLVRVLRNQTGLARYRGALFRSRNAEQRTLRVG